MLERLNTDKNQMFCIIVRMSLLKKAQNSIIPVRSQIDLLSEPFENYRVIEGLVLTSGLTVYRFEEIVDLEAHFTGRIGGVVTRETASLTFYNYSNTTELPIITSIWEKGEPYTHTLGALGNTMIFGARGKNEVGLKRFPDYANHFLDLLIAGRTLQ